MNPRQSVTELFSTFIEFVDDRFSRWGSDRTLRQNMLCCLKQLETRVSDDYWVLYWYKHWQQQPKSIAEQHLSAYLQEPCYWAAQRMTSRQTGVQYRVSDCFQRAIVEVPTVLSGYSPHQAASLKTYASLCFGNALRDMLRQQREADSRTDWGLLRKLSQKRLTESLQMAGLSADTIACYRLAWTCFKTHGVPSQTPTTRQLAPPDAATWDAIAHLYNAQRLRQLPATAPEANPQRLEQWLKVCAKQARAYLHPPVTSLNLSKSESGSGELQDDLPAGDTSPLTDLIAEEDLQERRSQRSQINEVLTAALERLDPQIQALLTLYCRDGLTQQQIAAQLETKQYTISRRLSSAKQALLLALAQWSQERLHTPLTSPALKTMSVVLEDWLQVHYQNPRQPSKDNP